MSFFEFDTTLPGDRPPASKSRGIFETPDPFAEAAGLGDSEEDAYVARIYSQG